MQKKKVSWLKIKAAYQRGEGSCRELAERFGISQNSVEHRCKRGKWRAEKAEIGQKVVAKVVDTLAMDATRFVQETIMRGLQYRKEIDLSKEQAAAPAIDPMMLDSLSRTEVRVTDMVRKAFGIPDVPQKVEHSGIIQVIDPYSEEKPE